MATSSPRAWKGLYLRCLVCLLVFVSALRSFRNTLFQYYKAGGVLPLPATGPSPPSFFPTDESSEEWKRSLFARLNRIRHICQSLCTNSDNRNAWLAHSVSDTADNHTSRDRIRLTIAPDVDCPALWQSADVDAVDLVPRFPPPHELLPYFTMGGAAGHKMLAGGRRPLQAVYLGQQAKVQEWSAAWIDQMVHAIQSNNATTIPKKYLTYGHKGLQFVQDKLKGLQLHTRQSVLVIGSETPWVEAICLALGAPRVTTLEYGRINSTHPQITTMTPDEMRHAYMQGTLERFDVIVSHSSVEHSGLGRYGDALNPWGDLLAVARAWCVATDNAVMYLGVPSEAYADFVSFNAHRLYHHMRWSLLTTNWVQMDGGHVPSQYGPGGDGALFRKVTNFTPYLDQLGNR